MASDAEKVSILPIGVTGPPLNLPLWVDVKSTLSRPAIYEGTFWFVDPLGEYIYYLAGDFEKSEHGYLAYGSAEIELRVEVTFEEDTISVHRIDDWRRQGWAEENSQYGTELSHMTLGEVLAQLPETGNADGLVNVMPFNQKYQRVSLSSMARFEFLKPVNQPRQLRMIFQALHQADQQPERLLTIRVDCHNANQNIGELSTEFERLIDRFADLPYEKLEGATRL